MTESTAKIKRGLAEELKGGVIMDVVNAEQARIAEDAGAIAVMALEKVPADIREAGGVARMADPAKVKAMMKEVSIPVMAKARIGHFVEARILESLGVDYVDESEVLTPADKENHIEKWDLDVPVVCGARNLAEAARRLAEGAAMIRTKGEAGTGNVVEAVKHMRRINDQIRTLGSTNRPSAMDAPSDILELIKKEGELPVVNFAAGGIATPADAALMMQLGADGVFVGSGVFKSEDPEPRGKAIVEAVEHYNNPTALAKASENLGEAMVGINIEDMDEEEFLQDR